MIDYNKISAGIKKYRDMGKSDEEINTFLRSKGVYAPELNSIDTQYKAKGLLGKTAEFLGAPSRPLVERAAGMFSNTQGLQQSQQQLQSDIQRYEQTIAKWKLAGKNTSNLEKQVNELKYLTGGLGANIQNVQTRGVSGKEAGVSAFQTGLTFLPSMTGVAGKALSGSKVPLAQSAGKALTSFQGTAQTSPFKYAAGEGATAGALFGGSEAYAQDKNIIGGTVAGAVGGAALGPVFVGGIKLMNPLLTKIGQGIPQKLEPKLQQLNDEITNIFGYGKTKGAISKNLDPQNVFKRPEATWLESLYNRSDDMIVPTKNGMVKFDPKKHTKPSQVFQANSQGYQQASTELNNAISALDNPNWIPEKENVINKLVAMRDDPLNGYDTSAKKFYNKILAELVGKQSPAEIEAYIGKTLNKYSDNFFNGATENIQNEVAASVKKALRDSLYDYAGKFEGGDEVKTLMQEIGAYKAVEDELIKALNKQGDKASAALLGKYGLSQMVSGTLFSNPVQFTKGLAFNALGFVDFLEKTIDAKKIPNLFNIIDDIYKNQGLIKGKNPIDLNKLRSQSQMKMLPGAADQPGQPAPRSVQTSGDTIPVAPNKPGVELTSTQGIGKYEPLPPNVEEAIMSLPPEQQEEGRRLIQQTLDLFGKKKIDSEGGSITAGVLTALGTIPGLGFFKEWAENSKPTVVINEDKVSPAKTSFEPIESLKEKTAARESRNWESLGYNSPYEVDTKTGSEEFGNALGKYQVRELVLKEWSERFLGKLVSKDEFLKSPELQEQFFEKAMERFEKEYNVNDWEHAIALWHKGWSPKNINKERDQLVAEAAEYLKEPK
jgi:hypothetical protein